MYIQNLECIWPNDLMKNTQTLRFLKCHIEISQQKTIRIRRIPHNHTEISYASNRKQFKFNSLSTIYKVLYIYHSFIAVWEEKWISNGFRFDAHDTWIWLSGLRLSLIVFCCDFSMRCCLKPTDRIARHTLKCLDFE